jgi:signal peptidase I
MPRVYEVARELGMSSRELMDLLQRLGHPVATHSSNVDESVLADLRSNELHSSTPSIAAEPAERAEQTQEAVQTSPGAVDERPEVAEPSEAEPSEEEAEARRGRRRSRLRSVARHVAELPLLIGFAFLVAVLVKTFLIQAFFIPSGSMQPTLQVRDRVLVEKLGYRVSDPGRGHVIVFEREGFGLPRDLGVADQIRIFVRELLGLPTGAREDFIKRVVAVGGDSIRYAGTPRVLEINGEPVDEPYLARVDRNSPALNRRTCDRLEMQRTEDGCRVPAGTVFVMGDNRGNSEDSRSFGPIGKSEIVGRAVVLIWPPANFGTL